MKKDNQYFEVEQYKKLFEKVLDKKLLFIDLVGRKNGKHLLYMTGYTSYHYHTIDIHNLANKCIEYIFKKKYWIGSIKRKNMLDKIMWESWVVHEDKCSEKLIYKDAETQPEAIFKACLWILEK